MMSFFQQRCSEARMIQEGVNDRYDDIEDAQAAEAERLAAIKEAQEEDEANYRREIVAGFYPFTNEPMPLDMHRRKLESISAYGEEWSFYQRRLQTERVQDDPGYDADIGGLYLHEQRNVAMR